MPSSQGPGRTRLIVGVKGGGRGRQSPGLGLRVAQGSMSGVRQRTRQPRGGEQKDELCHEERRR